MQNDNELYIIQKEFPDSFVKLSKANLKSHYKQRSIELKALEYTKDSYFFPENKDDPIIVIENLGYEEKEFFLRFNQDVTVFCNENRYYGEVIKIAIFLSKEHRDKAILPKSLPNFTCYILAEMTKKELESFNNEVLMCLLPLCKVTEKEVIDYAEEWKIKLDNSEEIDKQDKLTLLEIYSCFYIEVFNKTIAEAEDTFGVEIMYTK